MRDPFNVFTVGSGASHGHSDEADRDAGGALRGVSVGVKDCFFHRGRHPTMGSRVLPAAREQGATAIERIEDAGGRIAGYTNLHEWAVAGTSAVPATGPIRNPWDPELIAGGSSGGSAAAVAAGMVDVAVGTDAGGSIRIPAACCGVVGLKPSYGLVPTEGYVCAGGPTDHIGALARSVTDAAGLVSVMTARDLRAEARKVDPAALCVGVVAEGAAHDVVDEVGSAFEHACMALDGIARSVVRVDAGDLNRAARVNGRLFLAWTARLLGTKLETEAGSFDPSTLELLERGRRFTVAEVDRATSEQEEWRRRWAELFRTIDVLVSPTLPVLPPPIVATKVVLPSGPRDVNSTLGSLNGAMDLTGYPCLSLPCADAGGLTVNLSITAAPGRDSVAIALGSAFEDATERRWVGRIATL